LVPSYFCEHHCRQFCFKVWCKPNKNATRGKLARL